MVQEYNATKKLIISQRKAFLKSYDKTILVSIVSNLKTFMTLDKELGNNDLTKLEIAKINEENFGLLIDYIISGNKGYIGDYRDSL